MNFGEQNPGNGMRNIFQSDATSTSSFTFGSSAFATSVPKLFGSITQQTLSTSGPAFLNQPVPTSSSNNFIFGNQATFSKAGSGPVGFGSSFSPGTKVFGSIEPKNSSNIFSPDSSSSTLFGQAHTSQVYPATTNASNTPRDTLSFSQTLFGTTKTNVFVNTQVATGNPIFPSTSTGIFGNVASLVTCSNQYRSPQPGLFSWSASNANLTTTNATRVRPGSISSRVDFQEGRKLISAQRLGNDNNSAQTAQTKNARAGELSNRLKVTNIPEQANNEASLLKHFSKFGQIIRIISKPESNSALVIFSTLEGARNAERNGQFLEAGIQPLLINFKPGNTQRVPSAAPATRTARMSQVAGNPVQDGSARSSNKGVAGSIYFDETAAGGDGGNNTANALRLKQIKRPSSPQPSDDLDDPDLKKRTTNSDERYRVLEKRDKIIRNAIRKGSDPSTSHMLKGTCTDMCPEKERYMREANTELCIFETIPGTDPGQTPFLDHMRAVKEYSRSSADQEVPLPSELRPPHVLRLTMDYLLTDIIDRGCVGLWGQWYNFLWDRMRGIRKDMTQQMLCDVTSVELVEKSARFHILCCDLLCEENPGVFDLKINDKGVTNCLQTLKELYHDLRVKHGIVCQNEAEFRSYMILMNINNAGDILREAQNWSPKVRQSEAFKSSMLAYSSVTNNNYIKFFKLVAGASYLSSCILHRYFNQVRSVAVTRIAKAFNSPASNNTISYPFQELINHLGFESSDEAERFLNRYGLSVTDGQITSDNRQGRVTEQEGATLPLCRSLKLVGSKIKSSLGEVVNAGPLPSVSLPTPRNSFDEQGHLILDDLYASLVDFDQSRRQRGASDRRNVQLPWGPENYANEIFQDLHKEVLSGMLIEIAEDVVEDSHRYLLHGDLYGEFLYKECIGECIRECAVEVIGELKMEREEFMNQLTNQLMTQICEEVIQSEVQKLCSNTLHSAWLADTEVRKDNATLILAEEILQKEVENEMVACCNEYYKSVKRVVGRQEDIQKKEEKKLLKKSWNVWKGAARQKQADRLFPSTVNLHQNLSEIFDSMFPRNSYTDVGVALMHNYLPLDGNFGVSLLGVDEVISRQNKVKVMLEREEVEMMEKRKFCWSPLNLFQLVREQLYSNPEAYGGSNMFWKVVLVIPSEGSVFTYKCSLFIKWLKRKFCLNAFVEHLNDEEEGENVCLVRSESAPNDKLPLAQRSSLNVCVRSFSDIPSAPDGRDLFGASAVVFFLKDHSEDVSDDQVLEVETEKLSKLLRSKPAQPSLPLLLIGSSRGRRWTGSFVSEKFELDRHVAAGLIDSFLVILDDDMSVNSTVATHQLENGVKWLLQRTPRSPQLQIRPVLKFFEENLNLFYIKPILKNLRRRKGDCQKDLPLGTLVSNYNNVARWLIQVATNQALGLVSWPPSECCSKSEDLPSPLWNTKERLNTLEKFLHQFVLLLEFDAGPLDGRTWEEACSKVWEYIDAIVRNARFPWKLLAKIDNLLEKTKLESGPRKRCVGNKRKSVEAHSPSPSLLPTTSIILACIDFKLNELLDVKDSCDGRPLVVTYFEDMLVKENCPSLNLTSRDVSSSNKAAGIKSPAVSLACSGMDWRDERSSSFICDQQNSSGLAIDSLFELLSSEKEATKSFGEYLEKVLRDEDVRPDGAFEAKRFKPTPQAENPPARSTKSFGEPGPSRPPGETPSLPGSIEDELGLLKFKIEQEKRDLAFHELKIKLLLQSSVE